MIPFWTMADAVLFCRQINTHYCNILLLFVSYRVIPDEITKLSNLYNLYVNDNKVSNV
jgi:hypothetical protein